MQTECVRFTVTPSGIEALMSGVYKAEVTERSARLFYTDGTIETVECSVKPTDHFFNIVSEVQSKRKEG